MLFTHTLLAEGRTKLALLTDFLKKMESCNFAICIQILAHELFSNYYNTSKQWRIQKFWLGRGAKMENFC